MTHTFPADPERLSEIRRFVTGRVADAGLPSAIIGEVVLAVSELCTNVLRHTSSDHIELRLQMSQSRIDIEVADSGVFHSNLADPGLRPGGGRGLSLVMALMDEVTIKAGTEAEPGTVIRLTKHIG